MNARLLLATLSVVLSLAVGQWLFKATAIAWNSEKALFSARVMALLIPSLAVYGFATLAWIWVLRNAALKTAYPFMALAFVIVPIGAFYFFGERITPVYCAGAVLIALGVIVTSMSS